MGLTVVLLNYRRECNVHRICGALSQQSLVQTILVWNNGFESTYKITNWPKVVIVNSGENRGVIARYALASLAMTDCVLIQDDDVLLPEITVAQLHEAWRLAPEKIHGLFGRQPKADGTYADCRDHDDQEIEIICGRAMMFHRQMLPFFWQQWYAKEVQEVYRSAIALNLGTTADDIVMSYTAISRNRALNVVHDYSREELPAEHALNSDPRHYEIRNNMMMVCRKLSGARYIL